MPTGVKISWRIRKVAPKQRRIVSPVAVAGCAEAKWARVADGEIHNGELLSLAVRSIVFLILKLLSCRRFCIPGAFRLRLDRVHSDTTIHPTPHRPDLDNHTTMSSIWSSIFFLFLGFCICSQHPLSKMSDKALDWLQDKTLGWMDAPPTNKLDTHHHFVPPFYSKGESTPY